MRFILMVSLLAFLASCGSTKKIDTAAIKRIKKVAVIVYSVPEKIEFRENPRGEKSKGFSLADLAKALLKDATAGVGSQAATIAMNQFVKTLKYEKLPFKVITLKEMKMKKAFKKLAIKKVVKKKEKKKSGWMSMAANFAGVKSEIKAHSPTGLREFGLSKNWWDGKALMGSADEKEYIDKAIKALGVDAVLVINDPGFSFSCKACIGGTGAASTGSAFNISLVGKGGKVLLNLRQWFGTSSESSAVVTGIVNPYTQNSLFKAHGEKTAKLFSEEFKEALAAKQ
ncbi:MAG: hypothetical protein ACI9QD_000529 [Thermoproteota archaeon]|jgi:hypothetical protein